MPLWESERFSETPKTSTNWKHQEALGALTGAVVPAFSRDSHVKEQTVTLLC